MVRFHKLGSLARALQLPWPIIGDFNVPAATLAKTGSVSSIAGGGLYTGCLVTTCTAGASGSLIDYAAASNNCLPCIISVAPVVQVPWKTR
eukprot:6361822-Pyramimonas_sp.AAC.1